MPNKWLRQFADAVARRLFTATVFGATVLATGPVGAHDVLISASFRDNPVEAEKPTAVTLRFNAAVEPSLSRVFLLAAEGEEIPLRTRPGTAPGEMVVKLPPLKPGAYGLRYKVLASDGYFTDETVQFQVR